MPSTLECQSRYIYISEEVNSYLGMQGGYDMPTFIITVDAARGTIINFKSIGDYIQFVDILNPIDINCLTVKLQSLTVAPGLPQTQWLRVLHDI